MFKRMIIMLCLVFLTGTALPSDLFSYEGAEYSQKKNKIDESLDYKAITYKKARCPRCGMEFYYMPGKESPHSHWVQYEISKDLGEKEDNDTLAEDNDLANIKDKKALSEFLKKKREVKALPRAPSQNLAFSGLEMTEQPQYELRQKLTCPYDGHEFFPEGDVIEERKLMKGFLFQEEPSAIETSFSKVIPFGVSKELKQFGYDLFFISDEEKQKKEEQKSNILGKSTEALATLGMLKTAFMPSSGSTFSSNTDVETAVVPVGPNYVIGPGDTLVINIWGSVQETMPVEVDREGKIMLPKAGPLYVWGLKFEETENKIKDRLNQFYTNFKVDVSMGKLRAIQVYVMGEVKKPGSYNIPSQSTVFQALYACGGPTRLGTLRKIKIIHSDGKEEAVDLYDLLMNGKMPEGSRVQSGDTVFVQPIGDVVAVTGNVKRPAIYETKSEIALQDLLNFAGGVTPTGDLQRLQVERIENNERRVMVDIELKHSDMGKFSLDNINMKNGDMVMVSPVVRLKHNFVSVIGNVERPADYALAKGMTVSDLVNRAKGFLPGTYMSRAEIARVTKDRTRQIIPIDLGAIEMGDEKEDIELDEWDILLTYSESEINPPSFVEIEGAVNRPGKYELTPEMTITDLIFRAGGVKSDEIVRGGELFHIIPGEQPVVREIGIKTVSPSNILIDKDIMLHSGDALLVKSEPKLTERSIVTVKGEVRFPGTYSIRKGERLSSLIERAGGFTDEVFLDGTVFTRKSIKEIQEKMRQSFLEREQRTILEEQQSVLLRTGASLDTGLLSESMSMRKEMLEYISSVELDGRMVIKMKPVGAMKGTKYDILLEDGDALNIPQTPSAITVMGSVNNPASIPYEYGKGVEYYIRKTGSLTKHADRKGIYIIKANGEAVSKFMMSKAVSQGSTIVVPQEFKYWTPPGQILRDTVEMLSRIAIGVGIIAALD
ncbi:MAG: SLBB domain-containing protein [Candidatus Omnitrophica bacterium]|nr:SLBB domain-containing protein [Candidatus Omnitrophota bacterium]